MRRCINKTVSISSDPFELDKIIDDLLNLASQNGVQNA